MFRFDLLDSDHRVWSLGTLWLGRALSCLAIIGLFALVGCSKDEMKKMATSVQQTTQDLAAQSQEYIQGAVETVEQQLPATGTVTLRLDPELQIDVANVELIKIGDGRPNVIQIASYDTASSPNKFPCLLLHGQTSVQDVTQLVGETVPCDLYVQQSSGGEILMTAAGTSLQITFRQLDQKKGTLKASIGSGRLIGSDESTVNLNGGSFDALIKTGDA